MPHDRIITSDMYRTPVIDELRALKNLLRLKGIVSEEKIITTWKSLKKMQEELALPSLLPIKQHYYFYRQLIDIKKVLNLSFAADKEEIKKVIEKAQTDIKIHELKRASERLKQASMSISRLGTKEEEAKKLTEDAENEIKIDFGQLNQLFIEIKTLREFYKLPESAPMYDIITMIKRQSLDDLSRIGFGSDSLILKVLLFNLSSNKQELVNIQERLTIDKESDRDLFDILVAYGPLSRPELVELTGIARSSIYDSLQRLVMKGFVVQYSEKRSYTGRPTTVFDSLI
ncbi:MAG: helix-turn-helix domain-containing protein [Candidatus Hodarchaeales archaeon]|jgi:biotin operon repressor